jgi:hypothetical protein
MQKHLGHVLVEYLVAFSVRQSYTRPRRVDAYIDRIVHLYTKMIANSCDLITLRSDSLLLVVGDLVAATTFCIDSSSDVYSMTVGIGFVSFGALVSQGDDDFAIAAHDSGQDVLKGDYEVSLRTTRPSERSLIGSWLGSANEKRQNIMSLLAKQNIRTVTEALVPKAKTSPVRMTDFPPLKPLNQLAAP